MNESVQIHIIDTNHRFIFFNSHEKIEKSYKLKLLNEKELMEHF